MASILIIESHPILREALRQYLFPEHRTAVRERWSAPADLQGHDLVIVDRESLEEGGGGAEDLLRELQRLKIPSVWLHRGAAPALRPARLTAAVAKPLDGPALDAALQSLLRAPPAPETGSGTRSGVRPPADEPPGDETAASGIIELTEVVEDPVSDS